MIAALLMAAFVQGAALASELPEPSWNKLPRWRGFNLLNKFGKEWSNGPFQEEDFRWIAEMGFNFVRLPMDYRTWIKDGDWRRFDEDALKQVDDAVAYGRKYGIHVLINFHRAPGYTVASPKEPKSLWTDPEAQEVCALHWATFARRYRGIPNRNLSFNLFNEPGGVDAATHARVVKIMVDAIRKEDPDRLVICDALQWGNAPSEELLPLRVGVATRGYAPFTLTHYKASWVGDNAAWAVPTWPVRRGMATHLYASDEPKSGKHREPLVIRCDLKKAAVIGVKVHTVTSTSTLGVFANGKRVMRQRFTPGPGKGPWASSSFLEQWKIWQAAYDRVYDARLPGGTREIRIENLEGDWMTISEIRLGDLVLPVTDDAWGAHQGTWTLASDGTLTPEGMTAVAADRDTLWRDQIEPFKALEAKGFGIFVGEWGAFNRTPHDVVLRWAADCLTNWKRAGWGWAMWEFRGSFGILDSGRTDVAYEDFHGHKLDRRLLDVLQAN